MNIRHWSKNEGLFFFAGVTLLYVYPFILANYVYIDDGFRSIAGDANWNSEGRFLMTAFYKALSLTGKAPDMFPLPLILAVVLMAFALSSLQRHYFAVTDFFNAIVVLPLFFNPFFLSNLNYQYDGPLMTLGVIAMAFFITFDTQRRWLQWSVPMLLIVAALATYQPLLNVGFGLCCIELYRKLIDPEKCSELAAFVGKKLVQFGVAFLVYMAAVSQIMATDRRGTLALDSTLYATLVARFEHLQALLSPLYAGAAQWFFVLMLALAGLGYIARGWEVLKSRRGYLNKALASALYLLIPCLLVACVPGVMLIYSAEQNDSRLMLGVAPFLVFILLLIDDFLSRIHARARWVLVLPLLFMIGFSYSYGRLLVAKKELENTLVNSLAYSISANAQLSAVGKFYFSAETDYFWLPAAQGTISAMPIMPYVMSTGFLLMPYGISRAGITNVDWEDTLHPASAVLDSHIAPVLENKFYAIYVFKGDGYIIMKTMGR